MADPSPILTQLTTISIGDSGGTPVAIGGVSSITGIGGAQTTEIPTTTLASTAKEFKPGLRDFGSFTVTFSRRNQDDLGQAELFSAHAAQAVRTVIVTLPTSTANVITMSCFVQQVTLDINADGVVTGQAVMRITGAPAYT